MMIYHLVTLNRINYGSSIYNIRYYLVWIVYENHGQQVDEKGKSYLRKTITKVIWKDKEVLHLVLMRDPFERIMNGTKKRV